MRPSTHRGQKRQRLQNVYFYVFGGRTGEEEDDSRSAASLSVEKLGELRKLESRENGRAGEIRRTLFRGSKSWAGWRVENIGDLIELES